MKSTPTKAEWGKYARWSARFKTAGITIPKKGDLHETLEYMERQHKELTIIPDKELEMRRAGIKRKTQRPEEVGGEEGEDKGKRKVQRPEEVGGEEETPSEEEKERAEKLRIKEGRQWTGDDEEKEEAEEEGGEEKEKDAKYNLKKVFPKRESVSRNEPIEQEIQLNITLKVKLEFN